jgi:hypothetical protein
MSNFGFKRSRFPAFGVKSCLCCLVVTLTTFQAVRAEEDAGRASTMLENLKQRSAAERWERVKKQYPAETQTPRRSVPATLSREQQRTAADEALPPAPANGFSIPRLAALPVEDSADWIRPARPAFDPEKFDQETGEAEIDFAPDALSSTRVADSNAAIESTTLEGTVKDRATDNRTPRTAVSATSNQNPISPALNDQPNQAGPRTPMERLISSIKPYYDRDQDRDIRQFALEKGKEINIPFNPKPYEERSFPQIQLAWEASNFYYHPLYFSDPALERYGHSHHPLIQPLASLGRFGTQVAFLPYQMAIKPPCSCESPLGYYRPGECAPKLHYQVPLNAEAAVVEAAVLTGLFFVIP